MAGAARRRCSRQHRHLLLLRAGSERLGDGLRPVAARTRLYLDHPYELEQLLLPDRRDRGRAGAGAARGGSARASRPVPTGGATVGHHVPATASHFEQDIEYWPDATPYSSTLFWEKWFWREPDGGQQRSTARLRPARRRQPRRPRASACGSGALTDNRAVRQRLHARRSPTTTSTSRFNGVAVPAARLERLHGRPPRRRADVRHHGHVPAPDRQPPPAVRAGRRHDRLPGPRRPHALAWFDDLLPAHAAARRATRIEFRSPGAAGRTATTSGRSARTGCRGCSTSPTRSRRSSSRSTPSMYLAVPGDTTFDLSSTTPRASCSDYCVVSPDSLHLDRARARRRASPTPRRPSLTGNLRGAGNGADYLVIYYDALRARRPTRSPTRARSRLPLVGRSTPFQAMAVPVSALYDQFSGGRTDPAAIRNFLRAAFLNWSVRPKFVTFARRRLVRLQEHHRPRRGGPARLPAADLRERLRRDRHLRQYATDDWMLNVNDPTLGRARTSTAAASRRTTRRPRSRS